VPEYIIKCSSFCFIEVAYRLSTERETLTYWLLVGRIELEHPRDLAFPPVVIREQAFLVVVKFLARIRRELKVGPSTMASTGQASSQRPQ
jgi:hypothetical protein